jgi:hypothetical protein
MTDAGDNEVFPERRRTGPVEGPRDVPPSGDPPGEVRSSGGISVFFRVRYSTAGVGPGGNLLQKRPVVGSAFTDRVSSAGGYPRGHGKAGPKHGLLVRWCAPEPKILSVNALPPTDLRFWSTPPSLPPVRAGHSETCPAHPAGSAHQEHRCPHPDTESTDPPPRSTRHR